MVWNPPCSYNLTYILLNIYQVSTNGLTTNRFLQNLNNIIEKQNNANMIANLLLGWTHHELVDRYKLFISQLIMDLFPYTLIVFFFSLSKTILLHFRNSCQWLFAISRLNLMHSVCSFTCKPKLTEDGWNYYEMYFEDLNLLLHALMLELDPLQ
jgi:hypothetical protein